MKKKEKERWLRTDFDKANIELKTRNASEANAFKKAMKTADVNAPDSFPFTHGDCIERQRRHLSEVMQKEILASVAKKDSLQEAARFKR